MNMFTAIGILVVLLGFLFIGLTLILFVRKYLRMKNWTKTTGMVVNVQSSQGMQQSQFDTGSTRSTLYKPTVRFQTTEERIIDYTPMMSSSWSNYAVGENVEIQYDPQQPQKASIGTGSSSYLPIFIVGFFGVMAVLVGTFFVFISRSF